MKGPDLTDDIVVTVSMPGLGYRVQGRADSGLLSGRRRLRERHSPGLAAEPRLAAAQPQHPDP